MAIVCTLLKNKHLAELLVSFLQSEYPDWAYSIVPNNDFLELHAAMVDGGPELDGEDRDMLWRSARSWQLGYRVGEQRLSSMVGMV